VCGSVPVWATLGCRPANGQRQLAGERVPGAIRLRMPDLPRFSAILLRRDRRPASRSPRGCAGDASIIWLTPNVRPADARIEFLVGGNVVVVSRDGNLLLPHPRPLPRDDADCVRRGGSRGRGGSYCGGCTRGRHRRCQPRAMVDSPFRAASCGCRWHAGSIFEDGGCGRLSCGWSSAPRGVTQLGVRRVRRLPMRSEQALDPSSRAPAQIDLRPGRVVCVRERAGLGQRSGVVRRTASGSWLVNACRAPSGCECPIYRVFH
jgi:hypothetical protein